MDRIQTQKLARALHILVTVTLAVNILALVALPGLLYYNPNSLLAGAQDFMEGVVHAGEDDIVAAAWFGLVFSWPLVLADAPQLLPPCLFLLACGLCTAVILQQGRRILTTVEEGEPFQRANAQALRRAAVCCWGICALALIRLVWELMGAGGLAPLFTYNALFVPIFFMAGLLFLVMSALFRQASELKEDQDLTI